MLSNEEDLFIINIIIIIINIVGLLIFILF